MSADGVLFRDLRLVVLADLRKAFRADGGDGLMCEWQEAHVPHISIFCNLMSHVEALEDLLVHGTWCDDLGLFRGMSDDEDQLFRFYRIAFLVLEACMYDLRDIAKIEKTNARLAAEAGKFIGFINSVWKHRAGARNPRPAFHETHHHGPYLFADCPGFELSLPEDGAYLSIDHQPPGVVAKPLTLVVPSLGAAMTAFGEAVAQVGAEVTDDKSRSAIAKAWGDMSADWKQATGDRTDGSP